MWTTVPTPAGDLRIVRNEDGLTAVEFVEVDAEGAGAHSSVRNAAERSAQRPTGGRDDDDPLLREAGRQLTAYFAGDLTEFDLPLAPEGTDFQHRVWAELRRIGYGETASYGDLAGRLGLGPAASRAVGSANGRNPIAIVVPCHRVVGASGSLTGYAGGLERKRMLLELEQDALF